MIPTCPEGLELARNDRTGRWECREPGWRGLGDMVAAVAKPIARALGLSPNCGGCKRRQEKLNEFWPFDGPSPG